MGKVKQRRRRDNASRVPRIQGHEPRNAGSLEKLREARKEIWVGRQESGALVEGRILNLNSFTLSVCEGPFVKAGRPNIVNGWLVWLIKFQ